MAIDQNTLTVNNTSDTTNKTQPFTDQPVNTPFQKENNESPQDLSLDDYFHNFVIENQDSMNETELARTLGVSRKCLWERRQKLGIPRKKITKS